MDSVLIADKAVMILQYLVHQSTFAFDCTPLRDAFCISTDLVFRCTILYLRYWVFCGMIARFCVLLFAVSLDSSFCVSYRA